MVILDHINKDQIPPPIFSTAITNNKYTNTRQQFHYNLDHFILYARSSLEILKKSKFEVIDYVANTSDHRGIS